MNPKTISSCSSSSISTYYCFKNRFRKKQTQPMKQTNQQTFLKAAGCQKKKLPKVDADAQTTKVRWIGFSSALGALFSLASA